MIETLSNHDLYMLCLAARTAVACQWARRAGHREEVARIARNEHRHEAYLHSWGQAVDRPRMTGRVRHLLGELALWVGDGGEIRCGDILHDGCHAIEGVCAPCSLQRRLCGGCSRVVDAADGEGWRLANPEGCCDLLARMRDLEDADPSFGWEARAIDRARREGVLPTA